MAAGLPGGPVMLQEDRRAKTHIRIGCPSLSCMALASVLVLCGCLSGGTTRKTASVKAAKNVEVSPAELSSRNQSLLGTYSGEIEAAADGIIFKSSSPVNRRQALIWKADTIPVLQRSLLNTDPIAAVLDTWAFIYQMSAYMDQPVVSQEFGEFYPVVTETLKRMDTQMEQLVTVAAPKADIPKIRQKISAWAEVHPIQSSLAGRASAEPGWIRLTEQSDLGMAGSIKALEESLGDIAARMDAYSAYLPKQARWQAELTLSDIARDPQVGAAVANLNAVSGSLARTSSTIERMPELMGETREAVMSDVDGQRLAAQAFFRDERVAAFDTLEQERLATLAALRNERLAATADLRNERQIVLDAIHNERLAATNDFTVGSDKALKDLDARARGLIDHFFVRALEVVLPTLALFLLVAWLLLRKFAARREDRGGRLYDRAA